MTKHRQGRFVFSTVLSAILSYKLGHRIRCSSLNINRLDMFRSQPAIHPASLKESKEIRKFRKFTRNSRKFIGNSKKLKEIQRKFISFIRNL